MLKIKAIILLLLFITFKNEASILLSGELSRHNNTEIKNTICLNKDINSIVIPNFKKLTNENRELNYNLFIKSESEQLLNEGTNNINKSNIMCDENNLQYEFILKVNKETVIQTEENENFNEIIDIELYKDQELISNENIIFNLETSIININLSEINPIVLNNEINLAQSNICVYGNGISNYQIKVSDDSQEENFYLFNNEEKIQIDIFYNNGKGIEEKLLNNVYSQNYILDISEACVTNGYFKVSYNEQIKEKKAGKYKANTLNGIFYITVSTININ